MAWVTIYQYFLITRMAPQSPSQQASKSKQELARLKESI